MVVAAGVIMDVALVAADHFRLPQRPQVEVLRAKVHQLSSREPLDPYSPVKS